MPRPFQGKNVVLGVTGSIACYKAVDLASKLSQAGAHVDVIMTESATKFVSPITFRSITHRPVVTDMFDPASELGIHHVAVAERADIVVVAPATADFIAKAANGLADDALGTTILATTAPVLFAPAMDGHMYENAATQENLERLRARGVSFAGPASGHLASGLSGKGRLLETPELLGHLALVLGRDGDLAGRKVVVSAGGTQEAIDPVRIITNRSSGKMGYAIAEAARDRGAHVTLVTAPTALDNPTGVEVRRAASVAEMREAVLGACVEADVVVMAAAVSDYRPAEVAPQKIKKDADSDGMTLHLLKNEDFFKEVPADVFRVGFAAETESLVANAQAKLQEKGLDLIAANDVTEEGSGFEVETNRVTLVDRSGRIEELPLMDKYDVGHRILDRAVELMG
ncbi:MAG: bifunctional phosphopantothenoylcysteine decarboxylase/phosphopantothenate--cysteine ligase CoaBC [Dehalococcoidia bacterium]|nr:bifunctional phosphopantothenoylcysteine decarboxylase/phosphopantothenate--cysteine ligase CoaBC [Dehalococcoidia bacterium]